MAHDALGAGGEAVFQHTWRLVRGFLNGVHMRIDVSRRSLRGHDRPAEIYEAMHNLRHALQLHQGHWSPAEVQRVHDLLNNTAKAIVDG